MNKNEIRNNPRNVVRNGNPVSRRDFMDKVVCRMCGKCEYENPGGVAVSDILRYSMYFSAYGDREGARALYLALPLNRKVHSRADIKRYEKSCPYKLPLEQMLSTAHRTLS